jgi:hypothetical protein
VLYQGFFSKTFDDYGTQCVGVRFSIGKLVELVYLDAMRCGTNNTGGGGGSVSDTTKLSLDRHGMDVLRASLGHPFTMMSNHPLSIVSSVHGLDAASSAERFVVASRLWTDGISAEYLAQSGVMASLLTQHREEAHGSGTSVSGISFIIY